MKPRVDLYKMFVWLMLAASFAIALLEPGHGEHREHLVEDRAGDLIAGRCFDSGRRGQIVAAARRIDSKLIQPDFAELLLSRRQGRAESEVIVSTARKVVVAIRRPAVERDVDPTAASDRAI